ncbi:hypothetical protein DXG03_001843 [Asterophora parasitica]|uniref:Protein transport protein sec16 n=1 Tax=Asterophora parasitica TaxID=117018 RepID=A0A9P7KCL0_9AGAR|nr:hypothetical protein DXG03_001843 [Asterophora parasitica]
MNGVEAAASLFGSDEPGSDPFASLGAETAPQSSADDLFNGVEPSGHSDFLNASEGHDLFATGHDAAQDAAQFYTQPQQDSSVGHSTTSAYAGSASQQGCQAISTAPTLSPPKPAASVLAPPVPAPTATVTRPKISNAYDPPFPTTSKNRRGVRAGSGQQSYGYNTYETMSPPIPAYASSSQVPYTSQTPPPPHATPPPPQRLPPPPPAQPRLPSQSLPPPPQPRIPSQSQPPPPTRSPALPVQPSYNANGGHAPQNDSDVGVTGGGPSSAESFFSEGAEEKASWGYQPYEAESVLPFSATSEPSNNVSEIADQDPEASFPDLPAELSEGLGAVPYQAEIEDPAPPQASPPIPTGGPPLSLGIALRAYSPYQYALPPSPTLSQHQGRSSPFIESNIISTKRTGSPRSFAEPPRQKTPDVSLYISQQDTNSNSNTRSAPHMISSPLRSSSPASITNGIRSPPIGVGNPYLPKSIVGGDRAASPAHSLNGYAPDPYAPKASVNAYKGERTASPSSFRPANGGPPAPKTNPTGNSYAPLRQDALRNRSTSNSSLLSSTSTSQEYPYAPSHHTKRIPSEAEYGNYPSRFNYPNGQDASHHSTLQPEYPVQEAPVKSFQTPYAPSPSLMGANDPLGRTSSRVPIFSFGFGGKFVTCFHGADSLSTGFDVALASRNSTGVHIRVLKKLIPESALDTSTASFPGPLFGDSSSTSLVLSGANTQAKTKKAKVTKYLSQRTDELALGLRYLRPESIEGRRAEGKLVLVRLLQLMVEHDGRLTGTPELDIAVRLALVPRLEGTFGANGFSAVADTQASILPGFSTGPQESPISVTTLRSSALDKIQDFLLRGERRQAYHFALDEKLWAHAMVVSSSIDKDSWKEVVGEFIRTELGIANLQSPNSVTTTNGRESLRAAYSLFSGQGAAAVQELAPQSLLARANGRLQPLGSNNLNSTPRTPNFAAAAATTVPPETLSKWAETIAMMLSHPLSQEASAALTALGDHLAVNHLVEAAHVCYLLAPQTSSWGGSAHPSARLVLIGSRNPQSWPQFAKDQDSLIFSEIAEFALSLATPPKGQDAFTGIAHLQAYRFIRAIALAEIGDIQQANKYCDAVTATIVRSSPYATPALLEQLKGLSDRIAGVTQVDKSFWTGAKLSKPSLDTIGGWLEGRFTKLVTGDADMDKMPEEELMKPDEVGFSGPFSHYSTISSATPSARSSPQPSVVNLNVLPPAPPPRSGSAMASSSPYTHPQIDRASSAMDYTRRKPSPGPRIASAHPSTTSFASAPSFGQALNGQRSHNGYSPSEDLITPRPSLTTDEDDSNTQEATWWGGTGYAETSPTQTPTASTFMRVDGTELSPSASADGFISLMDTAYSAVPPSTTRSTPQSSPHLDEEDEEDLGFGNSKREKQEKVNAENEAPKSSPSPQPAQPAAPTPAENGAEPAAAGGWLSRWWKKSDAAPGPVKASLGEESAFYYDKDLKRWVNKKAGAEAPKPAAPPPPPSRAQTASPAMTGPRPPAGPEAGAGPPPNRPASAIDLSTSPPSRTVMRVRSNLVPTESAPSTPTGTRLAPPGPPPGRPKSQASKRNIRNRYVDVFQQEGGGA